MKRVKIVFDFGQGIYLKRLISVGENHSGLRHIHLLELRRLRLRSQCLFPRKQKGDLLKVIRLLVGVNAQLPSAMLLSLRARVDGLTRDEIDDLRVAVRTWCMRGTMHLLALPDTAWLLCTLPESLIVNGWRWLERRGGLPLEKATQMLDDALETLKANGPMTRDELIQALALKYGSQAKTAAAGILHLNGLLGRVCFGPDRGTDPTYVAMSNWVNLPPVQSGAADYSGLVRRYLQGYGPASPQDFAAWWGCSLSEAKKAWVLLKDELVEVDFEGQPLWMGAPPHDVTCNSDPEVRLLPAFDTYYSGYRAREFAVPAEYQSFVFHGGEITPVILLDGWAVGTWHYEARGRQIRLTARPFSTFTPEICELIAEEAVDIGRFYHLNPALKFE